MSTLGEEVNGSAPQPDMPMRNYYCRGCNRMESGYGVPRGWYALVRHPGSDGISRPPNERPWTDRLGVFCSVACIASHIPQLEIRERRTAVGTTGD